MEDPWGVDEPPAFEADDPALLPAHFLSLASITELTVVADFALPEASELPEVRLLMGRGWTPLGDAPLFSPLPAAWSRSHRTWVPDRRPQVAITDESVPGAWHVVPAEAPKLDHYDQALQEFAQEIGLPPRPHSRIWLVRSPWPQVSVDDLLQLIWEQAQTLGNDRRRSAVFHYYFAALEVMTWSRETVVEKLQS